VRYVETVADNHAVLSELFAAPSESMPIPFGDLAEEGVGAETLATDFSACYARELSSLVWFVMSLGADAHRAADVAQSAFAEAFGAVS
jgi:hypothetical protein